MPKPRKIKNRSVGTVLYIYCEGEKTEPNYLNGYLEHYHSDKSNLRMCNIRKSNKNTPIQLVDEAVKKRNSNTTTDADIFWVVYDRESTSKYTNAAHCQAFDKAKANNVELAISNVCFEIWLLCHLSNSTSPYTSCKDLLKNSTFKKDLAKLGIGDYEKGNPHVFNVLKDMVDTARQNSKRLNQSTIDSANPNNRNKPYLLNPYTDVYKLLDSIDTFLK